jgi:hypothetical protein
VAHLLSMVPPYSTKSAEKFGTNSGSGDWLVNRGDSAKAQAAFVGLTYNFGGKGKEPAFDYAGGLALRHGFRVRRAIELSPGIVVHHRSNRPTFGPLGGLSG